MIMLSAVVWRAQGSSEWLMPESRVMNCMGAEG